MDEPWLSNRVQWQGHWWLPSNPDERVPGVLTHTPDDGLSLSLIGGFDDRVYSQPEVSNGVAKFDLNLAHQIERWPMMHGRAEGKDITLLDCLIGNTTRRGLNIGPGGTPEKQQVSPATGMIGVHLEDPDQAVFTQVQVSIENLTAWSGGSAFVERVGWNNELEEARRLTGDASITTGHVDDEIAQIDGAKVHLSHVHTLPWYDNLRGEARAHLRDWAIVRLIPHQPLTFTECHEYATAMQDLISLTTNRAAAILWLRAWIPREPSDRKLADHEVAIYVRQIPTPDPSATGVDHKDFLATCSDIPFGDMVTRWFTIRERSSAALNIMRGIQQAPSKYIETQLLTAAGAAEILHASLKIDNPEVPAAEVKALRSDLLNHVPENRKKWFTQVMSFRGPSLRERLEALCQRPDPQAMSSLVPDPAAWARMTSRARNDLTHTGLSPKQTFDQLIAAATVTEAVITMNLLLDLGLSTDRQREAVQANPKLRHAAALACELFPA